MQKELDLRGEVCPYTYVRTKLVLEELDPGSHLVIWLDAATARDNVPRSASRDGHFVLDIQEPSPGVFRVEIVRGDDS